MNFETHSVLKDYTVVAYAEEVILDENDELDGSFAWVVYHNDSTHLFVARVDHNSGDVQVAGRWFFADAKEFADGFLNATRAMFERTTGLRS